MGKSSREKGQGKQEGERELKVMEKAKLAKAGGEARKSKGKGNGLQSVNEWDEWDQTEDNISVPCQSCD